MPIENPLKSSSWQKLSQGLDQKSWTPWESQKIGVFYSHWLLGNKHHGNPGNPRLPTHGYQELSTTIRYHHPLTLRALLPEPGCERLSVLERLTSHTWSVPDWLAHSPKEQSGALGRNTWEILALVQLIGKIHQNSAFLRSSHFMMNHVFNFWARPSQAVQMWIEHDSASNRVAGKLCIHPQTSHELRRKKPSVKRIRVK